ncbi:MAG TPA: hypothetical protein VHX20_13000 [Terracidiphilus sp.]|jgi:hypothetical protein|nr:hypothetical protein [Terracidiphilus sp.]
MSEQSIEWRVARISEAGHGSPIYVVGENDIWAAIRDSITRRNEFFWPQSVFASVLVSCLAVLVDKHLLLMGDDKTPPCR